eukprot:751830-Pleurochrysis_carterae.AAC.1
MCERQRETARDRAQVCKCVFVDGHLRSSSPSLRVPSSDDETMKLGTGHPPPAPPPFFALSLAHAAFRWHARPSFSLPRPPSLIRRAAVTVGCSQPYNTVKRMQSEQLGKQ